MYYKMSFCSEKQVLNSFLHLTLILNKFISGYISIIYRKILSLFLIKSILAIFIVLRRLKSKLCYFILLELDFSRRIRRLLLFMNNKIFLFNKHRKIKVAKEGTQNNKYGLT